MREAITKLVQLIGFLGFIILWTGLDDITTLLLG